MVDGGGSIEDDTRRRCRKQSKFLELLDLLKISVPRNSSLQNIKHQFNNITSAKIACSAQQSELSPYLRSLPHNHQPHETIKSQLLMP